ncbi:hypothetical protein HDV06_005509 [Boothiomyces sp. JEL0866]|nr:hypothetical protein HDV06_005509 [Boothiomyces sp. JEL0866]
MRKQDNNITLTNSGEKHSKLVSSQVTYPPPTFVNSQIKRISYTPYPRDSRHESYTTYLGDQRTSTLLQYREETISEFDESESDNSSENILPFKLSKSESIIEIDAPEPYVAKHNYIPSMEDEIQITKGDLVRLAVICSDRWAIGYNLSTQKQGAFPVECLGKLDN